MGAHPKADVSFLVFSHKAHKAHKDAQRIFYNNKYFVSFVGFVGKYNW